MLLQPFIPLAILKNRALHTFFSLIDRRFSELRMGSAHIHTHILFFREAQTSY